MRVKGSKQFVEHVRRIATVVAVAVSALTLGGCISANTVANLLVDAPNHGHPKPFPGTLGKLARSTYVQRLRISVGPPPATLAVAMIVPRDYGFYSFSARAKDTSIQVVRWGIGNKPHTKLTQTLGNMGPNELADFVERVRRGIALQPFCPAVGTVVLLPGWAMPKETLLGYALDLASHGYRAILVDMRGQGDSTGKYVTYGLIEHRDIEQVIAALYSSGLITGKLALVGFSEGATTALDTAAGDPRVATVIAVAPFTRLSIAVRGVGNTFMPLLSDLVSKRKLEKAISIGSRRIGHDLRDADPASRVGHIHAPVLYIAGSSDHISPARAVHMLADRTPHAHFDEIPRYTHVGLYIDVHRVGALILGAVQKTLGKSKDSACLDTLMPHTKRTGYAFQISLQFKLGKKPRSATGLN